MLPGSKTKCTEYLMHCGSVGELFDTSLCSAKSAHERSSSGVWKAPVV